MDRAQLEQLALEKISKMQAVPSSNMDRAALEQMALEKLSSMGQTPIDNEEEASLGVLNRAQYSLEPIQSNRKAFLEKEFGQENIMEDKNGELYLKQNGSFLPLNKGGVSVADAADFAGALPEMVGGAVGTVAGAVGGAGIASVPGAIALGAAGGALGSAARQGMSAMIGTPQVASMGERAVETGLSGVFGGVGTGLGLAAKAGINKVKPGISQFIKNLKSGASQASETASETVAKSNIGLDGSIEFKPFQNTEKSIMGKVADQGERELVQKEMDALTKIATEEGLPLPSKAQAAMGKTILAENEVLDFPVLGRTIRKRADEQVKKITENLEGLTGRKIDADSDAFEVGGAVREYAETTLEANKQIASGLYKQLEEQGENAMIGKSTLLNKFKNQAADLGVINPDGTRSKFDFQSGLTRGQFNKMQDTLFDVIDGLNNNPANKIRFKDANAATKMIKAAGKELKNTDADMARVMSNFGKELNDSMARTLNRESENLGKIYLEANSRWAKFRTQEKALAKLIGPNVPDEKVVKTIMSGTHRIDDLKELVGEDKVKEIAKSYVADILFKVSKSGVGAADNARNAMRASAPQIKSALGVKEFDRIMNNLKYLNSTGRSLTISRASLLSFLDFKTNGIAGATAKLAGVASTVAKSKGTTIPKAVGGKIFETTSKVVPTTSKGASNAANILGDNPQRSSAYFPSKASSSVTEKEKEIERRKRAISGSKP